MTYGVDIKSVVGVLINLPYLNLLHGCNKHSTNLLIIKGLYHSQRVKE